MKTTVRLMPTNVRQYIGHEIMFKTRKNHIVTRILGVSPTGKTIYIQHPDLKNNLEIVSRVVHVIVDLPKQRPIDYQEAEPGEADAEAEAEPGAC